MTIRKATGQELEKFPAMRDLHEVIAKNRYVIAQEFTPTAFFGWAQMAPGVIECWMTLASEPPRGIRAVRMGKLCLEFIRKQNPKVHRVQAVCFRTERNLSVRFCVAIGFEVESIMERYGPAREDAFRVVLWPE